MRYPETRMSWSMRLLVAVLAVGFVVVFLWSCAEVGK